MTLTKIEFIFLPEIANSLLVSYSTDNTLSFTAPITSLNTILSQLERTSKIGQTMVQSKSITEYRLTDHAKNQMARRQIYQSRVEMDEPSKSYLLRVFVDVDRKPPEIVTVYRTSKIEKYWRVDS